MKSKDPAFQLGYFYGKVDPSNLQDFYGKNTLLLFWDLKSVTLWIRGSCLIFFFLIFVIGYTFDQPLISINSG